MSAVRVGMIGCGNVAERHAMALGAIEEAELAAVCDLDGERARALAESTGADLAPDIDGLLARPDLDAALICLPATRHAEIGLRALEAGVHALVEKPLDLDLDAARRLVARARERGLVLSVVSQHRFHDDVLWLAEQLAAGALGAPVLVNAYSLWQRDQRYYDAAPGRGRHDPREGGVLSNQAVHVVDLLLWLCGPARSARALRATLTHEIAVEDTAAVLIELERGLATLVASTSVCPQVPERLEIRCERGTAILAGGRVTAFRRADGEPELTPPSRAPGFEAPDELEVFRRLHRDFARAVRGERAALVRPDQALAVVELLDAVAPFPIACTSPSST